MADAVPFVHAVSQHMHAINVESGYVQFADVLRVPRLYMSMRGMTSKTRQLTCMLMVSHMQHERFDGASESVAAAVVDASHDELLTAANAVPGLPTIRHIPRKLEYRFWCHHGGGTSESCASPATAPAQGAQVVVATSRPAAPTPLV